MKVKYIVLALIAVCTTILIFSFTMKSNHTNRKPITGFDLNKYLGTWYELARFDHSFERGLSNVTATYSMRDDGKVRVINRGMKDGKESVAEGKAKMNGEATTGHLKVSFFWIFYADYIILSLDKNYETAIVASTSDKYLWFLSRKPEVSAEKKNEMIQFAKDAGFDTSKLIWVSHSSL